MQCRAGSGGDGGARLVVTAVRGEPSHSEPVAFTPTLGPGGVMPRYRLADATGGPARLIDGPPGGLYSALRAIDHHEHRGISGLGRPGVCHRGFRARKARSRAPVPAGPAGRLTEAHGQAGRGGQG